MLAMFPWADIDEPLVAGPFHVVSFADACESGMLDETLHDPVAAVLASYGRTNRGSHASMPLLHHVACGIADDLPDARRAEYFRFGEQLAFSALASRTYFGNRYLNRDNLRLVLQGFTRERAGGAAITSRRRDGFSVNLVPPGRLVVARPEHVGQCDLNRDLDLPLLNAMVGAAVDADWDRFGEAILAFNAANTDSSVVSSESELVAIVGCFSRLFDAWDERGTVTGFACTLPGDPHRDREHYGTRINHQRLAKALDGGASVRAEWLADAYRLRGQFGHGRMESPYPAIWTLREHLLLSSYVFPLTCKAALAERSKYTLTDEDLARIGAFDTLATLVDPFAEQDDKHGGFHPWREVLSRIRLRPVAEALATVLAAEYEQRRHREG